MSVSFSCLDFVCSGLFYVFSFHSDFVSVSSCFSPERRLLLLCFARCCCCCYCTARDSKAKYQHSKGLFITKAGFGLSASQRVVGCVVVVCSVRSLCGGVFTLSLSHCLWCGEIRRCRCTPVTATGLLHVPLGFAPYVDIYSFLLVVVTVVLFLLYIIALITGISI